MFSLAQQDWGSSGLTEFCHILSPALKFSFLSVRSRVEAVNEGPVTADSNSVYRQDGPKPSCDMQKRAITNRHANNKPSEEEPIRKEEITLEQHSDFCVYMATADGGSALRYVMLPYLMDDLRKLAANDCVSQAIESTNGGIRRELLTLDPNNELNLKQLPEMVFTLKKKLCIGKTYNDECSESK